MDRTSARRKIILRPGRPPWGFGLQCPQCISRLPRGLRSAAPGRLFNADGSLKNPHEWNASRLRENEGVSAVIAAAGAQQVLGNIRVKAAISTHATAVSVGKECSG